jgi:exopolyphosphatase/guanosine-5'-triphosphate,3'-diphosphate pyrophosphatase
VALEFFGLRSVYYSAAGVRDGIIADLASRGIGRELSQLSRDQRREVETMSTRYGVSLKHTRKVAKLARSLFECLQPIHQLPPSSGKLLEAAAYLHDIGHYVNDAAHHKHSYYLVTNSDMSGFTSRERELVANLCRYHRKASPSPGHSNYQGLTPAEQKQVQLLIPLLRLADGLDRSHDQRIESVECVLRDGQITVLVTSEGDVDLEKWAAERTGDLFRQAYGRALAVEKSREETPG